MIDLVGLYPYKHSWKVPTTLINQIVMFIRYYYYKIIVAARSLSITCPFILPLILCAMRFLPVKKHQVPAPVKLFCPHPPGHPRDITFFWLPVLLITLFLLFTALIKHFNSLSFQYPAFFLLHLPVPRPFLSHIFFLWPWGCPIRMMLFSKNHGFDNGMPLTFVQKHFSII